MDDGSTPFTDGELRELLADVEALASTATARRIAAAPDDDRTQVVVLTARLHAGDPVDVEALAALAERLVAAGDAEAGTWAYAALSDACIRSGNFDDGLRSLRNALDLAPEGFPRTPPLLVRPALADQRAGELRSALAQARAAFASATAAGDATVALWAVCYLSVFTYQLGQMRRAEALALRLLEVEQQGTSPMASHMRALGRCVLGMVAAARGAWHESATWFDEGEAISRAECPWFCWVLHTFRGASLARYEAPMPDGLLDRLVAATPSAGEEIVWRFAHATGLAMAYHGAVDEGMARMTRALEADAPPWDRHLIELQIGEALAEVGRHEEARPHLRAAVDGFDAMGASYWLARAWVALARIEPDRADAHLAAAASIDDGDPAYARLFEQRHRLRIDVGKVPSVHLGERRVEFPGRQAEFTVYALAVAGEQGVPVSELVDVLWPSPDPRRVPQRVRTLLWQVRRALDTEAWRLRRDDDLLRLDLRGVVVAGLEPDDLLLDVRLAGSDGCPAAGDGDAGRDGAGECLEPDAHLLATWNHLGRPATDWIRSLAALGSVVADD